MIPVACMLTESEERALITLWMRAEERGDAVEANRLFDYFARWVASGAYPLPDSMKAARDAARGPA